MLHLVDIVAEVVPVRRTFPAPPLPPLISTLRVPMVLTLPPSTKRGGATAAVPAVAFAGVPVTDFA